MKGRKPKPTKLKLLHGTFRKDRANLNEPEPEVKIPSPPDYLIADALQEWGRMSEELYQFGMLAKIDRAIFSGYCQSYGRWAETQREINKKGMVIKTITGNIIQSPLVGIANKQHKLMNDSAALMGIPATMRGKVQALQAKKQSDSTSFSQFSR